MIIENKRHEYQTILGELNRRITNKLRENVIT